MAPLPFPGRPAPRAPGRGLPSAAGLRLRRSRAGRRPPDGGLCSAGARGPLRDPDRAGQEPLRSQLWLWPPDREGSRGVSRGQEKLRSLKRPAYQLGPFRQSPRLASLPVAASALCPVEGSPARNRFAPRKSTGKTRAESPKGRSRAGNDARPTRLGRPETSADGRSAVLGPPSQPGLSHPLPRPFGSWLSPVSTGRGNCSSWGRRLGGHPGLQEAPFGQRTGALLLLPPPSISFTSLPRP